ncbi:MAG: hypothetical protein CMN91_03375 [Synechococcus sp. ARS1019]|nr:hypothetical protein [Synechococcus sp. ARS1019]
MIRLLLLLPVAVVLARMAMEWLWFGQFNWQDVLVTRWLLQAIAAVSTLGVIWIVDRWRRPWLQPATKPNSRAVSRTVEQRGHLRGWRFSAALVLSSSGQVVSTTLFLLLAIRALNGTTIPWQLAPPLLALSLVTLSLRRLRPWLWRASAVALVFITARAWPIWAQVLTIPDAGLQDPVLGADLSFALGRFSGYRLGLGLVLLLETLGICSVLTERLMNSSVLSDWQLDLDSLERKRLRQATSAVLLTGGLWVWLMRHQVLWSQHGIVAGAGWLQVNFTLPLRSGVSLALVALAIAIAFNQPRWCVRRLPSVIAVGMTTLFILEGVMAPMARWLVVNPQELSLQSPFIAEAIQATRHAFQLDSIERKKFVPSSRLTAEDLKQGASTLDNVRLWDSAPLLETNRQLQQLRVYYHFNHAVVDRYPLRPDQETAQQVILSAREMDQSRLPKRSRTWQNKHFVFTHGYGFTLSPVNAKAEDGLPAYFISDLGSEIRIEGNNQLSIRRDDVLSAVPADRASLYFGMLQSPYAITGAGVDEFDYPDGDENVFSRYGGQAGIRLSSPWHRLAAALFLQEPRLLTTQSISADSRLLIRRELRHRIKALAPFLDLRGDPYLVSVPIADGTPGYDTNQHQYWIIEGYTHSSSYPYSAAAAVDDDDRYLRNAVKIVVDAYNGSVHFYVNEPNDPIIRGWMRVFPSLFESIETMPAVLKGHLRVPEELFNVQVRQLQRYHVTDPRSFYSGDDIWEVPMEMYGRKQVPVVPYHITAQVEDNTSSEFLLLQPLTPQARPNLNAWLAARNDGDHYGELLQIEFPRDQPILGPEQIQALINQDPAISQRFGLWDRAGSEVIQGNLLVLPIGRSLLYVEPVYLRASKGGLPSLQRIVVSDGKRIAMAGTLPQAIDELIKKTPTD